jgi:RNA polymerase sigma-70 factor (ECF subfamily)
MSKQLEKSLIDRALRGNQSAFEILYRTYQPPIYRTILPRTSNQDEAEDLVQVTFMRAFQGLRHFRGDAAFLTWLTRIAINVCHSHRQLRWVRQAWMEETGDETDTVAEAAAWRRSALPNLETPEDFVCRKERSDMVKQRIREMRLPYRDAMWLRYVKDQSYAEITRELDVPMGTLKAWLCRGRRQLQSELEELAEGV